ncbi:MAG: helix-turn-helix transcriptional regulator [Cyclobacteriaceae bacterium]
MSYFNKNIRFYRKNNRLTQDAFAEMLDIKKGKLIAWENKSEPKFGELVRICETLKVNLIDFISKEITKENFNEFFADKNSLANDVNEPFPMYGKENVAFWGKRIDELDVFSLIDRVIYTGDAAIRSGYAQALKTEVGKLMIDLTAQKDKNIALLEKVVDESADQKSGKEDKQSDSPS